MTNLNWLGGAALAAVLVAGPQSSAAAVATGFDPLDAAAVRAIDWPHVADSPPWPKAPEPGQGRQLGKASEWRVVKVARSALGRVDVDVDLQADKRDPSKHRIVVSLPVVTDDTCHTARSRLSDAYGAPVAERAHESGSNLPHTRILSEHAQWRADATVVTLDCLELKHAGGGTVYLTQVDFEPAGDALPLLPLFALRCPGLVPPGEDKKPDPADDFTLIFDSRGRLVERTGDKVPVHALYLTVSPEEIAFTLMVEGSLAHIDRASGRYSVGLDGKTLREGVCTRADVPG
jgi:hypothetical protein